MSTIDTVERVVAPVVQSFGLELVDLELRPGSLRVTVDRPGGVDLDAVAKLTGAISRALDGEDPVPGSYELEVSSPGLERRLRTPDHFRKSLGSEVAVRTLPGGEGERRVSGVLAFVDEERIRLEGDSIPGGARELSYREIERAHTIFDWRAELAGNKAPSGRAAHKAKRREQHASNRRQLDDDRQGTQS